MKVYPPCREDQLRDLLLSQYSYASIPYKQKMQGASAGDLKYSSSIGATSETPVTEFIHPSFNSLNGHDFFKEWAFLMLPLFPLTYVDLTEMQTGEGVNLQQEKLKAIQAEETPSLQKEVRKDKNVKKIPHALQVEGEKGVRQKEEEAGDGKATK